MRRSIVALGQVPSDWQDLVKNCFYCCPKHGTEKKKAVAAIATEGQSQFFGICGYHAEAYPLTEEQRQQRPMVCPYCFPRSEQ
jgi:hypothetical protein